MMRSKLRSAAALWVLGCSIVLYGCIVLVMPASRDNSQLDEM